MNRRDICLSVFAAGTGGLVMGSRRGLAAARAPLIVVVAPDSPLIQLSFGQLRSIYRGDVLKDPAGNRTVPMNQLPNTPDRIAFDRLVLGMEPDEVGRYWIDRRLRGHGAPPRSIDNPHLLQRLIQKFPGAICYVRLDQRIGGVKILNIDRLGPADAGYPLA